MKAGHYEKWSQIELFDYVSRLSICLTFQSTERCKHIRCDVDYADIIVRAPKSIILI